MKIKIGFGYEQATPGLYLYDTETGLVVASYDVEPSEEIEKILRSVIIDTEEIK